MNPQDFFRFCKQVNADAVHAYVYAANLKEYSRYSLEEIEAWAVEVWPNLKELGKAQSEAIKNWKP